MSLGKNEIAGGNYLEPQRPPALKELAFSGRACYGHEPARAKAAYSREPRWVELREQLKWLAADHSARNTRR